MNDAPLLRIAVAAVACISGGTSWLASWYYVGHLLGVIA